MSSPQNRRSAHRHEVSLPATLTIEGQGREITIENMSLGGAQVVLPERLPLGQRVQLVFQVPGRSDTIEIDATVRWSATESVGLQFAGLRPKEVWLLNQYFASLGSK